jgi:dienelactone hydrolase
MRTEDIAYTVHGVEMLGRLVVPAEVTEKRPGVLVCHEGSGLSEHVTRQAVALAEIGYVAFVVDYLGGGGPVGDDSAWAQLSSMMEDPTIARERGKVGLDILLDQPEVDAGRVAAAGYCFGAVIGLELARTGADLKAVIGHHPGLVTPRPEDSRRITASILMCIGTEDPYMTLEQRVAFETEMREAQVADWQIELYGGVGHGFTNPEAAAHGLPGVEYHQRSAERSWRSMCALLDATIGTPAAR